MLFSSKRCTYISSFVNPWKWRFPQSCFSGSRTLISGPYIIIRYVIIFWLWCYTCPLWFVMLYYFPPNPHLADLIIPLSWFFSWFRLYICFTAVWSHFGCTAKQRIPFGLREDRQQKLRRRNGPSLHGTTFSIECTCWKQKKHFATTTTKVLSCCTKMQYPQQKSIGKSRWVSEYQRIFTFVPYLIQLITCTSLRFINFEALAYELTAYFFLATDKNDTALQYFLHAHEKYHDWGAFAKCNALFQFVQKMVSTCTSVDSLSLSDSQVTNDEKSQRKKLSTTSEVSTRSAWLVF